MTERPTILTMLLLAALLAACTQRIDPSTPESAQASIEKLQDGLSDEEREKFSTALGIVIANALGGGYLDLGDTPEGRKRVREALAGKTAQDIIAEADRIQQAAGAGGKG
ncbi:MAG: hypothetical protein FJ148_27715 [Deltaproteobacteria bacterium]|nr:hypothetical protein [Deltaproteobacteria bacterium]